MSTTTMHFGPEWMRTKHQPTSRPQHPPSPPPANGMPASASGTSTYSSLVSATPPAPSDKIDDVHPFRYSKEEMLSIFQDGGGKGGLGIEVERWEGVVREVAADPVTLREMSEAEKKLFAGSLNSEMRRRPSQSTDFLSPLNTSVERPRMLHSVSATTNSPLRERFGGLKRRDSSGGTIDLSSLPIPRKPSISALPSPGGMHSPRDVVPPRTRVGYTPNFDGVLNNGESWVARRRASEASMKAAARDGQTLEQAPVPSGIREEKEDDPPVVAQHVNGGGHSSLSSSSSDYTGATSGGQFMSNGLGAEHHISGIGSSGSQNERSNLVSPPGLLDPSTIQWSYKDPTGQTQGPFSAEIMHSWHKGGYFTPDLPMKRIHVDDQWITLQDLISQATTDNIFLTPPMPVAPPGLNRTSPMRGYLTQDQVYNEPHQPAPLRSMRTSTLESFMGGSESPSSSFGASQFGNSSPDPTAFGGRDNRAYFGADINGRTGFGIPSQQLQSFPNNLHGGMEYNHDYGAKTLTPLYGNLLNGHTSNNRLGISQEPWPMASGSQSFGVGLPSTGLPAHLDHSQGVYGQEGIGRSFSQNSNSASYAESVQQHQTPIHLNSLGYINQFEPSVGTPYSTISEHGQHFSTQVDLGRQQQQAASGFGLQALEPISSQTTQPLSDSFASIPPQSPWNAISDPIVNSALPVVEEPQAARLEQGEEHDTVDATLDSDAPLSIPTDPTSSSPAELSEALNQKLFLDESDTHTTTESISASESSAPAPSAEPSKRSKKSKAGTKVSIDSVAPLEQPKSAWAKDEDGKKKKTTSTSVSLRDIQEAEAKKQESRKAADREKERVRAAGSSIETKEDIQPFTAAWGLPTSQAGNRNGVSLSVREVPPAASPSSATTPATPVWAAPPKTPVTKKSMKEIQEEEEKRKKQVAAKESAVVAAQKKAYAETMAKNAPSPSPVAPVNTVWTTVGANGKTAAAAAAASLPARPPAPSATVSSNRVTTTSTPKPATNSVLKARPPTKAEDISDTPSHDFLKWLGDSLKGLNSSVNVEEIMAMLLSFPIDADSSTQEIISDTIYANSTTLDGRRFASEFVTKRRADAATRPKGIASNNGKVVTKPVSIADVVKSVPKPTQPEWGFKVVNKKKKGGRA